MKKISQARLKKLRAEGRAAVEAPPPEPRPPKKRPGRKTTPEISDNQILAALRQAIMGGIAPPPSVIPAPRNIEPIPDVSPVSVKPAAPVDGKISALKRTGTKKRRPALSGLVFNRDARGFITGASTPDGESVLTIDRDMDGYFQTVMSGDRILDVNRDDAGSITGLTARQGELHAHS